MSGALRLTSEAALGNGYVILTSADGPLQVKGPGGDLFTRCRPSAAQLIIASKAGDLYLRAAHVRRARRARAVQLDVFTDGAK